MKRLEDRNNGFQDIDKWLFLECIHSQNLDPFGSHPYLFYTFTQISPSFSLRFLLAFRHFLTLFGEHFKLNTYYYLSYYILLIFICIVYYFLLYYFHCLFVLFVFICLSCQNISFLWYRYLLGSLLCPWNEAWHRVDTQ